MRTRFPVLLALMGTGCTFFEEGPQPYYPSGGGPSVTGLDVVSEQGNLGGGTVTIQGSGFGSDAGKVVVLFGDKNAGINSVSDTSIEVVVPPGPVACGSVSVTVATESGYDVADAAYTYDPGPTYVDDATAPTLYDDESAYLVLQNYRYTTLGDDNGWIGLTGVAGSAEFLEFVYPRYHTQNLGLQSAGDQGRSEEWIVQTPGQVAYIFGLEDLRLGVGRIDVTNAANAGDAACVDGLSLDPAGCGEPGALYYDLSRLSLCEEAWLDPRDRFTYASDWPVDEDFFDWRGGEVTVTIPDVVFSNGLPDHESEVNLTLPEQIIVYGTEGFDDADDWTGGNALGTFSDCFDDEDDEDDETWLDDVALRWEWEPNPVAIPVGGPVLATETYVRFNLTVMTVGWIGGEAYPIRATLVVPDDHGYDEETGRSSVELPTSVLYQFPTVDISPGGGSPGRPSFSDPTDPRWAYMFVSVDRITEYRIDTDPEAGIGLRGDLVVAYSTGDFTIFPFDHPLDEGDCGDCLDGDRDGWVDADDPDCEEDYRADGSDPVEDGLTDGMFTCNDGLDNDSDGDVDAEDEDCESGDGLESNCDDGEDNDDDGWTDEDDGECLDPNGVEDGADTWTCSDGVDSDGDGWIDGDDPDCETGADEETGFGTTACNDGVDNDGHGDVDALDPYCARRAGAGGEVEAPPTTSLCADEKDNDGDGYVDANDPDCETGSFNDENRTSYASSEPVIPECYDAEDNDGDKAVDSSDPGCWNLEGEPDGFLDDEAAAD